MYNTDDFHPYLDKYPKHIAIIPDGGRRWATDHGCSIREAYTVSVDLISSILAKVFSDGAEVVSLYLASTSNFKRSKNEVEDFCGATWDYVNGSLLNLSREFDFRIKIVGTRNANFEKYCENAQLIEDKTRDGKKTCNVCFNYSSLDEIEEASQKAAQEGGCYLSYLQIPVPVDILIRTGGAKVLSNFLLPQLTSARLCFSDKLFNDLTLKDVDQYINEYIKSELKYGE